MVQPINYMALLPQPDISSAASGLAEQIKRIRGENQAKTAAEQYRMDLENTFRSGKPEDFSALIAKYPQQREAFKESWDILNESQKESEFNSAAQIYSALKYNPEVAKSMLDERISAMDNSGMDSSELRQIRGMVDINPNVVLNQTAFTLSTLDPDKWKKMSEQLMEWEKHPDKLRQEELAVKKAGADLGLTQAQTKQALAGVEKTNAETQKLILEMEAAKSGKGGPVDPAKRFDLETKLRGEYSKETKNFNDVQEAYRRIEAAQDTAAGDLGLIFSYMKMLDPGSVVREGEFATAQNAAGVPERVVNIYNNLLSGERLNPGQRKSFRAQAGGLFNAARQREQEVRSGLTRVANSYGLNTDNVFLAESPATAPTTGAEQPSYMKYSTGGQ